MLAAPASIEDTCFTTTSPTPTNPTLKSSCGNSFDWPEVIWPTIEYPNGAAMRAPTSMQVLYKWPDFIPRCTLASVLRLGSVDVHQLSSPHPKIRFLVIKSRPSASQSLPPPPTSGPKPTNSICNASSNKRFHIKPKSNSDSNSTIKSDTNSNSNAKSSSFLDFRLRLQRQLLLHLQV